MNYSAASAELVAAMERLEPEPEHTRHVAFLAVRLFDELRPLHGLGPLERVLLDGAARLHDVGGPLAKGGVGHHKLSAQLIREQEWRHLSPSDVEIVAQVARYHRKSPPTEEHPEFDQLPAGSQVIVRQLSALLRLADGLDRGHRQDVIDLRATCGPRVVQVILYSRQFPAREIAGAERKVELAQEIFGREFRFTAEVAQGSLRTSAAMD